MVLFFRRGLVLVYFLCRGGGGRKSKMQKRGGAVDRKWSNGGDP